MADRKNGLVWERGKSPQQVFGKAVERYAGAINDRVYRLVVTEAPGMQEVLQQVGTWDDNRAEGGDYIRAAAWRQADAYAAGINVWYDLESYRVLHPNEDPDYDWVIKHIESRGSNASAWVVQIYSERVKEYQHFNELADLSVDDRVVETFHDEARYLWDTVVTAVMR